MLISYIAKAKMLYVRFRSDFTDYTRNVSDGLIIRYGNQGLINSLEFLYAPDFDQSVVPLWCISDLTKIEQVYVRNTPYPMEWYASPLKRILVPFDRNIYERLQNAVKVEKRAGSFHELIRLILGEYFSDIGLDFPQDHGIRTVQARKRMNGVANLESYVGVWYFEKLNTLYLKVSDHEEAYTRLPSSNVEVDFDNQNRVVGVEIRDTQKYLEPLNKFEIKHSHKDGKPLFVVPSSQGKRDNSHNHNSPPITKTRMYFTPSQLEALSTVAGQDRIEIAIQDIVESYFAN